MATIKVGSLVDFLYSDYRLLALENIYILRNPGIVIGSNMGGSAGGNRFLIHWKNGEQTIEHDSWLGNTSERQV